MTVVMPALDGSMTEATVTAWLVGEGDAVDVDRPIVEIATDRIDAELWSPVAGTVRRVLVPEDGAVRVGEGMIAIDASEAGPVDGQLELRARAPDGPEVSTSRPGRGSVGPERPDTTAAVPGRSVGTLCTAIARVLAPCIVALPVGLLGGALFIFSVVPSPLSGLAFVFVMFGVVPLIRLQIGPLFGWAASGS